jgi:hypothetical protein
MYGEEEGGCVFLWVVVGSMFGCVLFLFQWVCFIIRSNMGCMTERSEFKSQ